MVEVSDLPPMPSEVKRTPTLPPSGEQTQQPPTHPQTLERSFSRDAPIQIPDNPEDIPEANPIIVAKTADGMFGIFRYYLFLSKLCQFLP